jgi:Tfp pilus assembly protein PilZ
MSQNEQETLLIELEDRLSIKERMYVRKPYVSPVYYNDRDRTYIDCIKNISAGGVFIETGAAFSVGQEITLAFPLPIEKKHVMLEGLISRVNDRGIGVKFKAVHPGQKEKMRDLVDMI